MEEIEKNNDDEISLIDLFAVLVRYRKMIVIGTLASVFISLVCFFAVPKVFSSSAKNVDVPFVSNSVNVSYGLKTEYLPLSVYNMTGFDILQSAVMYMQDPVVIAECQGSLQLFDDVVQAVSGGDFSVDESAVSGGGILVKFRISSEKKESTETFMNCLVESTNLYLENTLMREILSIEKNADSILAQYGNLSLPVVWQKIDNTALKSKTNQKKYQTISLSVNCSEISEDIKNFKATHKGFVSDPLLLNTAIKHTAIKHTAI
ncbi:Wzz/FepE/Etk N-terminal domain-containing protein, partial [Treponema sp.]|uniref:Wzz/FepE/Etk N-terminal domain-containing protein n=1 Tax=Treponema sp. TaxID=166 RepID=UPI003EFE6508